MDSSKSLQRLGQRLLKWRLDANETQKDFGARFGASIPTVRRMENGNPNVAIHYWMDALIVLGRGKQIDELLAQQRSLFDEPVEPKPRRKRARRKAATP